MGVNPVKKIQLSLYDTCKLDIILMDLRYRNQSMKTKDYPERKNVSYHSICSFDCIQEGCIADKKTFLNGVGVEKNLKYS